MVQRITWHNYLGAKDFLFILINLFYTAGERVAISVSALYLFVSTIGASYGCKNIPTLKVLAIIFRFAKRYASVFPAQPNPLICIPVSIYTTDSKHAVFKIAKKRARYSNMAPLFNVYCFRYNICGCFEFKLRKETQPDVLNVNADQM